MRRQLSKSDIKELNQDISGFGVQIAKGDRVETMDEKILVNSKPWFFHKDGKLVPTVHMVTETQTLRKITVDMGAVKFVVGGADIMRPGIVEIEDGIMNDDLVAIIDINNKKPLAVGMALYSSEQMRAIKTGKAVQNIHYVGDRIWTL